MEGRKATKKRGRKKKKEHAYSDILIYQTETLEFKIASNPDQ